MKIKINSKFGSAEVKVFIDDVDISSITTSVVATFKAGDIPTVSMDFAPDEIEIDGEIFTNLEKLGLLKKQTISLNAHDNVDRTREVIPAGTYGDMAKTINGIYQNNDKED